MYQKVEWFNNSHLKLGRCESRKKNIGFIVMCVAIMHSRIEFYDWNGVMSKHRTSALCVCVCVLSTQVCSFFFRFFFCCSYTIIELHTLKILANQADDLVIPCGFTDAFEMCNISPWFSFSILMSIGTDLNWKYENHLISILNVVYCILTKCG